MRDSKAVPGTGGDGDGCVYIEEGSPCIPVFGDDGSGGGLCTYESKTLILNNCIVANSSQEDCYGAITSTDYNLHSDGSCKLTQPHDIPNTDPKLGPLADNGGPTLTHALLPGSPAIDAGDTSNCPETDQRGFDRPVDGDNNGIAICDIGSFEAQEDEVVLPGDLNKDGFVDGEDYQEFRKALGKCTGDSDFNSKADYDVDGCVSYRDYRIWYGYYLDYSE